MGSLLADIATMGEEERVKRVKAAFQLAPKPTEHTSEPAMKSLLIDLATEEDNECIKKLQQVFQHSHIDDSRCETRDKDGNTILHIAAINMKPKSVKWIMEKNILLMDTRNEDQETPLEALQSRLDVQRTRRGSSYLSIILPVSNDFKGFTKNAVSCLQLLKGLNNLSSIAIQRLTFGCTCGQHTEGFLSSRMRFALLCQAEINSDMMQDDVFEMSGEEWVQWNDFRLGHVPHPVRENMKTNKSMRAGFANLCNHFATCLKSNKLPTAPNVLDALQNASEWPPMCRNFLQRGGTVSSVGSMLFSAAMDQDELAGDGEHMEIFRDQIEVLPECRNDHEFGFVSGMCGYKRVSGIVYTEMKLA